MNDLITQPSDAPMGLFEIIMDPSKLDSLHKGCKLLAESEFVPTAMKKNPMNILIAMCMGRELGIPDLQALQDIAVINGKPCLYGDGLLAVVQNHKEYEWHTEKEIRNADGRVVGYECTISRRGSEPHAKSFTETDAQQAGLFKKPGPWTQYPLRMCQMRARSLACRDKFADALRGMKSAEEVMDYVDAEVSVVEEQPAPNLSQSQKALLSYKQRKGIPIESCAIEQNADLEQDITTITTKEKHPTTTTSHEIHKTHEGISAARRALSGVENSEQTAENEPRAMGISKDTLDKVNSTIQEKLTPERRKKALEHYNVPSVTMLTEAQGLDFIQRMANPG